MGITYSEDQQNVIDLRNKNMLVSAAAGSGKTTVLVERIIKKVIEDKVDIDKILVVTFTNASAQDMKAKVLEALEEKLNEMPGDEHLIRQSTLIHNAMITTIDSFCLNLVKENFHKIGLDPSFRIANLGEDELLMDDAMNNIISEAYEERSEDFYNLVDCYSKKDKDKVIEGSIRSLYSYAMSYPWPEKWLEEKGSEYNYESPEALAKSKLMEDFFDVLTGRLEKTGEHLASAKAHCKEEGGPEYYTGYVEQLEERYNEIHRGLEERDFDRTFSLINSINLGRMPNKKNGYDEELTELVREEFDTFRAFVKRMKEVYFTASLNDEYDAMKMAGRNVRKLADLTLKFKAEFDSLKRNRGIIDFADMEHMAVDILIEEYTDQDNYRVSDVAREYRNRYNEVMIDEYQDSNLVQEILLAAVSHQATDLSPNRFMVGDIKQSIYRFRLARPAIFKDKVTSYDRDPDNSQTLYLKENYRSRKEVVDSVNCIFENIMDGELNDIEYTENERLYAKAGYKNFPSENKTELRLIENGGANAQNNRALECREVANMIIDLVGKKQVEDKKTQELRPAEFRDIALLLRGPSGWTGDIREAFNKFKIPFRMEGVGTFYAAREIQEIINFLRVLDNPLNDIPLYGTMVSFFGGLKDEECALIKGEAEQGEFYLYEKLSGFVKRHPENDKARKFVEFIENYRSLCTYTPIDELITMLVTDTGYLLHVLAEPDGKQREANVELLIKKATDYAKTSFSGLFHFLRYVELLEKIDKDEGEAGIIDENADNVHIMSIHKSKGLEFPIVIIMDLEGKIGGKDNSDAFIVDIDEGIGAEAIDPEKRIRRSTLKRRLIAEKNAYESLNEEIRVLYVAMTRAREKLIMVASMQDAGNYPGAGGVLETGSFIKLIRNALVKDAGRTIDISYITELTEEVEKAGRIIEKDALRAELETGVPDEKLSEEIKSVLDYSYPHSNLKGLYTKTTVSNIKMAAMEETQGETEKLFKERERSEYIPAFAGGGVAVSGTDRGNAYHRLMQLVDFAGEVSEKAWRAGFDRNIQDGMVTAEEVGIVNLGKLCNIAKTELAQRMHNAALRGELFKEQPFVMGVPARTLNPDFPEGETVLVQGVIDAFFYENDEIVVLDYKTDKVDSCEELVERYRAQLDYYGDALVKLTGKHIKEKLLYSFGLNEVIVVE